MKIIYTIILPITIGYLGGNLILGGRFLIGVVYIIAMIGMSAFISWNDWK